MVMSKSWKKKIPTYLTRRGWAGQFTIQPLPAYSHKLPYRVPIGVREARYQPNYCVLGLKVIPILQAPLNGI